MDYRPDDPNSGIDDSTEPARLPMGTLTFLLTDIEGSTPLWEQHGTVMGAALARHEALIAQAVASHAGQLVKARGEGDSTLSVFVRASDAAAAAVTLQRALATQRWPDGIVLATRAALHTGEVELRDGDYYGQTLNRAARLRALGRGGQILLSRATADLVADQLPTGAKLVDVGAHHLKGLSRRENVFALVDPHLPAPPLLLTQRAEHPDQVAFIGRDSERSLLGAALDNALGGQGQLVLIAGEAGIGKTRIAEELCVDARAREARVVWGRCHEGEGAPAYWPWRQALRAYAAGRQPALPVEFGEAMVELAELVPELVGAQGQPRPAAALDPEMARFRLFDAMSTSLRSASAETGLVVVLDDLHWADRASLLLLEFMARELADSRLLLVGTYRDVEVDRRHRLSSTLAELYRQPVTSFLTLGGLDQDEVSRFICNVAGIDPADDLVAAVHGQTEGNPYFVSEVVRLLVAENRLETSGLLAAGVPEGIRHVIGRRLNQLSEAANSTLSVAAVQGRDFDLAVVARAGSQPDEAVLDQLEEATAARLVAEVGSKPGRFRFAHALVRETLYEELPPRLRRQLHERVGTALAEHHAADLEAHLAELAHHHWQAARPGHATQALDYARRAGDRAMTVLAYEEAAAHYERAVQALDLQGSTDQNRRCELLLALGAARMAAGEVAAARVQYERAAALAKQLRAGEQLAQAAFGLGVEFTAGIVDDLEVRLLEEALEVLGAADSTLRARVLARLAKGLQTSPQQDRRARLSDQAVAMARRTGDPATLATVLYERHLATWTPGNLEDRLALSTEVVHLAQTSGDRVLALRGRGFLMANLLELGDMPALRRELAIYERTAQELRQLHFLWHIPMFRAGQEVLHGRFDEAERLAQDALVLGRRARDPVAPIYFGIVLTQLRWDQGRLPELEASIRDSVDRYPANLGWQATLTLMLWDAGRREEARSRFERLAAVDFAGVPSNHLWTSQLAILAIVCHGLADATRASRLYQLLLPYADHNVLVARLPLVSPGSVSHYLGMLAAAMSRWDDAASHLEAAMRVHERMDALPLLARSRFHYAHALVGRGRPDDQGRAEEHLASARTIARQLGMPRLAAGASTSESWIPSTVRTGEPAITRRPPD
jgi:class 3 adenylate cyclase/tetratricopeptide (TPR) repeat protein